MSDKEISLRAFWLTYGGLVLLLLTSLVVMGQKAAELNDTVKDVQVMEAELDHMKQKLNTIEVSIGKVEANQYHQEKMLEKIYEKVK